MARLTRFLILATGLAVTAFSLNQRVSNKASTFTTSVQRQQIHVNKVRNAFYMSSAEDAAVPAEPAVVAAAPAVPAPAPVKSTSFLAKLKDNAPIILYLAVWYLGNIYYNIYNKKACIALGKNAHGGSNLHWLLSAVQLLVGVLFCIPLWVTGIRKAPELTVENWKELAPVGGFAALAHAFSVLALGAGAVSFGQIVKAGEPVFAAATNAILLKQIDHPMVYAALIPIIGGVGLASLKELSFSWTALIAASLANQAAALKNVVSKNTMTKPWAKALGPSNSYSVITLLALVATIPLVLFFDVKDIASVYQQVLAAGTKKDVMVYSLLSGLTFYVYNEASFLALDKLDAVTHSVANTLKRVVIIVASCIVFKTPMSLLGGIGSGIAVLGTLLYSMAKSHYGKGKGGH